MKEVGLYHSSADRLRGNPGCVPVNACQFKSNAAGVAQVFRTVSKFIRNTSASGLFMGGEQANILCCKSHQSPQISSVIHHISEGYQVMV